MTEHFIALQKDFATEWPGPTGPEVVLSNDSLQLVIYPHDGCRIRSLKAFDIEVLREWDDNKRAFQYGCFPMVPWVGRVENGEFSHQGLSYNLPQNKAPHAMHGIACMHHWHVLHASKTKALFQLTLDKPWPFKGAVLQEIQLIDHQVLMKLSIIAQEESFPASAGWHPWFKKQLGDNSVQQLLVNFNADWLEEPGNNEVPTGNRIEPKLGPWDDTFGFNSGVSVSLHWGDTLQLDIESSGDYLTVFDKQPDATCVNTMTDRPNGINSPRVTIVTPEQPLEIETLLSFS
ncbi:aldose 1-epimerase [Vibrio rhodolitus]|uniref:aldose epimerase family protein n=1 Tax=Vibrio rhodolitus TaxID=2231649 RepID=UPI001ABF633A|nr:aldose 1-epimerase [Vibrio rhodolitus]